MSEIGLIIADKIYGGWKSVNVDLSMENLSGTFNLVLTDRWAGQTQVADINPHDSCTLTIDGDVILTGYVDIVNLSIDATNHQVQIAGRDRAADLIDCTSNTSTGQYKNLNVPQIIERLCEPFGIGVSIDIEAGDPIPTFNIEQGATIHEIIQKLCNARGCLAISDGLGGIKITRAGSEKLSCPLVHGLNILSGQGSRDYSQRFSMYVVKGQTQAIDEQDVDATAGNVATVNDTDIARYRPMTFVADGQASRDDCAKRATWELTTRRGRSRRFTITTNGWRQPLNGELWSINKLVYLESAPLRVADTFLIVGINFSLSDNGEITTLSLAPADAYAVLDVPVELNSKPYDLEEVPPDA